MLEAPHRLLSLVRTGVLDLLFPRMCLACNRDPGDADAHLCASCMQRVLPAGPGACGFCGSDGGDSSGRCPSCRGRKLHFAFARGAARYEGPVRDLVLSLKFGGLSAAAVPLGRIVAREIESWGAALRPDLLVPVPAHWTTRLSRGYNQAELIAMEAGRTAGIRTSGLLRKTRRGRSQVGLARDERLSGPSGSVDMRGKIPAGYGRICVVDDVMTTAATVSECARVLRDSGAAWVAAVAAARQ